MKPKTFVAIALMFSLLVAGLILVLGLSSDTILPVSLMLFLLAFFALSIFLARELLGENVFVASILLILLAISASFFLTSLKTYHSILNEYGNLDNNPEINFMQAENTYSTLYAEYLVQRVLAYQNQSKIIEGKIAELEKLKLEQAQQASQASTQPIVNTTPQITISQDSYTNYYEQEQEGD